jgi:hypothetical protein
MTKTELKLEIQKALDHVPEHLLQDVLNLLKDMQKQTDEKSVLAPALRQILDQDKELLEKLAH